MSRHGFHWTPCDAPTGAGGGGVAGVLVVGGFVLWAVTRAVVWAVDLAQRASAAAAGAGAALGWAVLTVAALAAATVVWAVVSTRRIPMRQPAPQPLPRHRDGRPKLDGAPRASLTRAEAAELAELVAAVPMPERVESG